MPRSTATKKATARKAAAAKKTTARKATTPLKKAVAAKTAAEKAFARLTKEEQEAVVASIMAYPDGCRSGKRDYIKKVGLPVPPRTVAVRVSLSVPIEAENIVRTRYDGEQPNATTKTRIQTTLQKQLEAAGFMVSTVHVGRLED